MDRSSAVWNRLMEADRGKGVPSIFSLNHVIKVIPGSFVKP